MTAPRDTSPGWQRRWWCPCAERRWSGEPLGGVRGCEGPLGDGEPAVLAVCRPRIAPRGPGAILLAWVSSGRRPGSVRADRLAQVASQRLAPRPSVRGAEKEEGVFFAATSVAVC